MKHIQKKEFFPHPDPVTDLYFKENGIFFDIETTGFSPSSSIIYLIGCLRQDDEHVIIDQFFAETKEDEKELLLAFLELVKEKMTIITFNGVGFDIPFINAKCTAYGITDSLKNHRFVDIFKLISNIKFLLKLPNYKQKTIEAFLEIPRDDSFSGGELIAVYEEYLSSHSPELEKLLLLHNFEDVTGMPALLPVLSYTEILNGAYTVEEASIQPYTLYEGGMGQELVITLKNDYTVPKRVSHHCGDFYLTMIQDTTKIRVPVYEGTLKFFYPNYKDYYYLPKEDMAIHKSVADFVDKEYKEKARAGNCYTKKDSMFLPQFDCLMTPVFRKEPKDKISYFEYTKDFIKSNEQLSYYVAHIMRHFLSSKGR